VRWKIGAAAFVLVLAFWPAGLVLAGCGRAGGATCPHGLVSTQGPAQHSCRPCSEPCLTLAPPAIPAIAELDQAQRAEAYVALERYVRLYAVPLCGARP
jgi:hypothetical protein